MQANVQQKYARNMQNYAVYAVSIFSRYMQICTGDVSDVGYFVAQISIPVSVSEFLAWGFRVTGKSMPWTSWWRSVSCKHESAAWPGAHTPHWRSLLLAFETGPQRRLPARASAPLELWTSYETDIPRFHIPHDARTLEKIKTNRLCKNKYQQFANFDWERCNVGGNGRPVKVRLPLYLDRLWNRAECSNPLNRLNIKHWQTNARMLWLDGCAKRLLMQTSCQTTTLNSSRRLQAPQFNYSGTKD